MSTPGQPRRSARLIAARDEAGGRANRVEPSTAVLSSRITSPIRVPRSASPDETGSDGEEDDRRRREMTGDSSMDPYHTRVIKRVERHLAEFPQSTVQQDPQAMDALVDLSLEDMRARDSDMAFKRFARGDLENFKSAQTDLRAEKKELKAQRREIKEKQTANKEERGKNKRRIQVQKERVDSIDQDLARRADSFHDKRADPERTIAEAAAGVRQTPRRRR
jgi:hypothetical protein